MDLRFYLAMTAAEFLTSPVLPARTAWMACHFSGYGTGITNLPDVNCFPSMVILNDRTPPNKHDKNRICRQMNELADNKNIQAFLLDFQRPDCRETESLVDYLTSNLCRPTGVSALYGKYSNGPVFINMPLPHQSLTEQITYWSGREIWMELATEAETLILSEDNYEITDFEEFSADTIFKLSPVLHSIYHVEKKADTASISLIRRLSQLEGMIHEANNYGISTFIGLYQQLGNYTYNKTVDG